MNVLNDIFDVDIHKSVLSLPCAKSIVDTGDSAASVSRFSPGTSSALDHSTSELLRTLSMSGCF